MPQAWDTLRPATAHQELGEKFYRHVDPASFPELQLRYRNDDAAFSVGLNNLNKSAWVDHFGRFVPFYGSYKTPLALCYHGHQFGHYNPELGDGRGFLFAQCFDNTSRLMDLGTKGSGTTPFSRKGDGRLTLKGAVREILATEMLEALGVNTSRTLSVIETGERLQRQDEPSPARSAVLVRLSHSHIRIGSFQRLFYHGDVAGIELLARHVAKHYYNQGVGDYIDAEAETEVLLPNLLHAVSVRIAKTAANWMAAGFVHGVLNTDNFNITGESFDYGPWRFLPNFDAELTAAYFDETGRYAYGRQPDAALWAVCRLADCFVSLVPKVELENSLQNFFPEFESALAAALQRRLGINFESVDNNRDAAFVDQLFTAAKSSNYGYDQIFHDLYGGKPRVDGYDADDWRSVLGYLADAKLMRVDALEHSHFRQKNAVSMTINDVENLWAPIAAADDWMPLKRKLTKIRNMRAALSGHSVSLMPKITNSSNKLSG